MSCDDVDLIDTLFYLLESLLQGGGGVDLGRGDMIAGRHELIER